MKQIIIDWLKENFNSCLNENETVLVQRAEELEDLILVFMEYNKIREEQNPDSGCDIQHESKEAWCGAR